MNFKLSPYQYHALDPRSRMAASLSGFAGFSNAAETRGPNGSGAQLIPDSRFKTLVTSVLQAPAVGSGLTRGYRSALTPSADRLNLMDGGLEDGLASVPRYTHAQGSNRNPFVPTVARFAGFAGGQGPATVDMTTMETAYGSRGGPSTAPLTSMQKAMLSPLDRKRLAMQSTPTTTAAAAAAERALLVEQEALRAAEKRLRAARSKDEVLAARRSIAAQAEHVVEAKKEAVDTQRKDINPDAVAPVDTNLAPATVAGTKSNTLLYVGAAAVGLGALYLLTRKKV